MEENMDTQYLVEQILDSSRKQAKFAKWQCFFSALAAVCCVAVLVAVFAFLPQVNATVQQAQTVISDVQQVTSQLAQADWDGLTSDLEKVSKQIADANLGGLAQDVSALVQSSQVGLDAALGKLNAIDLEGLNKAIADLTAVIEPMAKVAKMFG